MKKFLPAFLLLCCLEISAQNTFRHQALELTGGPAWFQPFQFGLADGPSYRPQTGWNAGVDYSFSIHPVWDVKVGFRYHESILVEESGGEFYWPSEYATGVYIYDPSLPHSFRTDYAMQAWQYTLGTRLMLGQPKDWRGYVIAEFGLSRYRQDRQTAFSPLFPTAGLGFGLQYAPPGKRFGVFCQPMLRYMYRFGYTPGYFDHFSVLAVEVGLRTQLFSGE